MGNKLMLAVLTAMSGIASGGTLMSIPDHRINTGLFFGVATAYYLVRTAKIKLWQVLTWVAACIGSWFVALQVYLSNGGDLSDDSIIVLILAGLVGATMLAILFKLIVRTATPIRLILTVLVGGLAAALMHVVIALDSSFSLVAAFTIWQVSVALTLIGGNPKR